MLWPTKMPTRMTFSHSKIRDPVRGRTIGCSSLKLLQDLQGLPANCDKPRFELLLQQICRPCKYSYYDTTLKKQVVIPPYLLSPLQNLVSDNCQGVLQGNLLRRKRTKDVCCMMLLGCLLKDLNQRGNQLRSFEHGIKSDLWFLVISMCIVSWFSWDSDSFP